MICGADGMSLDELQMGSDASILDCFTIGTKQSRQAPGPPNPEDLGPLDMHAYWSPEAVSSNIIKCKNSMPCLQMSACTHHQQHDSGDLQKEFIASQNLAESVTLTSLVQHFFGLVTLSNSSQNGPAPIAGEWLLSYHAREAVWDETAASCALHIQHVNNSAKKLHSIWNEESLVGCS